MKTLTIATGAGHNHAEPSACIPGSNAAGPAPHVRQQLGFSPSSTFPWYMCDRMAFREGDASTGGGHMWRTGAHKREWAPGQGVRTWGGVGVVPLKRSCRSTHMLAHATVSQAGRPLPASLPTWRCNSLGHQPPGMRCSRCITAAPNFMRMTVFGRGWPATGT